MSRIDRPVATAASKSAVGSRINTASAPQELRDVAESASEAAKAPPPPTPLPEAPTSPEVTVKWLLPLAEGVLPLIQGNRHVVQLKEMQQNGVNVSGRAASFGPEHSPEAQGMFDGAIDGDNFEISVYWDAKSVGVYRGTINPRGRVEGVTFDRFRPEATTSFYGNYLLVPAV